MSTVYSDKENLLGSALLLPADASWGLCSFRYSANFQHFFLVYQPSLHASA